MSAELIERERHRLEQRLERLRAGSEERAQIVAEGRPFDYDAWVQEAGPALPEELAEMEEMLREREQERDRELRAEVRRSGPGR